MEIEISLQNSTLSFHFLSSNLKPPSAHGLNLFFYLHIVMVNFAKKQYCGAESAFLNTFKYYRMHTFDQEIL
jgi:hypothetical protein